MNTFKIKIFDAQGTRSLAVGKPSFCIGSSGHCDVVLPDASIHSEHVRVWCEGGRLWIQDLGTAHGTTINDMRLPPLKPMLCREIDTLKLGSSPFTISIEPVFVRAPQAKTVEPPKGVTKALEAEQDAAEKRLELEKASRELADLRLQIQMARLEKDGVEEIKKYRESVQEQIKELEVKKNQMLHEMAEWEKDKVIFRKRLDKELSDLRAATHEELKDTEEREKRRFEEWRIGRVAQMTETLTLLMDRRVLPMVGKPLSASQFRKFEKDFAQILSSVLLDPARAAEELEGAPAESTASVAKRPSGTFGELWRKWAWGAGGAAALAALVAGGYLFFFPRTASRSVANVSSGLAEGSLASTSGPRYLPATTPDFKKSYTDNVLFTTLFVEREQNPVYRSRWTRELSKATVEWQLASPVTAALLTKEIELIRDLTRIKEAIPAGQEKDGIGRMRAREAAFQADLLKLLQTRETVDRFLQFKRNFYQKNQNLSVASAPEQK